MGATLTSSCPAAGAPHCTHQGILNKLLHRRGQVRDDLSRANPGNRDLVDRYDARLLHSHDHWALDLTPYLPNEYASYLLQIPTQRYRQVRVTAGAGSTK